MTFASWSDGGAQTHNIVAPTTSTTYTANFSGGGTGVTLTPVADSWVLQSSPTKNKGSDPNLKVRESSASYRTYLQFVVTGLSAPPTSVTLRLFATNGGPLGGSLFDVSDSWSESAITWANAPPIGGTALNAAGVAVAGSWTEIDLTSYVTGNGTYSIGIRGDGTNTVAYASSETVNAPQLVIGTEGPPVGGTLAPTDDARVVEANPTSNKGSDTTLRVKEMAGSSQRSYLKFTVSGLTGAPSQVTLRLFGTDASPDGGSLYDVSDGWSESAITWTNAPPISGSALGSLGSVVVGAWVEVDLTSYVTGNGTYSIAIRSNSTNAAYFSSAEGANPPQLVVTP